MVPSYVQRIMSWPSPKTVKELTSLLGLLNYYSSFIKDFSKLTAPMNAQRKAKKINWDEECELNFRVLKQAFEKAPLRSVPDFQSDAPFIITTDWSDKAIGAVLSQEQGGAERMIAAGGRKCSRGEQNYPSWKGEMAALVYALRKYHHILSFKPFVVHTDASALKHLRTLKQNRGIISRWLEEIQQYQFEVIHKPGRDNVVADALSRSSHLPEPSAEEEAESREYLNEMSTVLELDRSAILEHQSRDEIFKLIRSWVSRGQFPTKKELQGQPAEVWFWRRHLEDISIAEDGLLQVKLPDKDAETVRNRIMVPHTLKKRVFEAVHEHKTAGHFGIEATMARFRRSFHMFNVKTEVMNRIRICQECVSKEKKGSLKQGIHYSRQQGYPLEMLYVDLIGPLNQTQEGFKYILSMEDGFSRYAVLHPLRTKETPEVTRILVEKFVASYGCPNSIFSDNGREFTSKLFEGMCKELNIVKKNSPPYCPQSNKVERLHRTIGAFLRMSLSRENTEWNRELPFFQMAYNTKVHASTGVTPSLAFMGREMSLPLDLMVKPPEVREDLHQNVRSMMDRVRKMYKYIAARGKAVIRRNAEQYEGLQNPYKEGDLVWYYCPRKLGQKPAKLINQWIGPFKVTRRISEVLIEITSAGYSGKKYTVHTSRVREFRGELNAQNVEGVPSNLHIDDEDDPQGTEVRMGAHVAQPVELAVPVVFAGAGGSAMVDLQRSTGSDPVEEVLPEAEEDRPEAENFKDEILPEDSEMPESEKSKSELKRTAQQKRKLVSPVGGQGEVQSKRLHRRAPRRPHETSDSEPGKGKPEIMKKSAKLLESSSSFETDESSTENDSMNLLESYKSYDVKCKLREGSQLPVKQTAGAAGWDLCSIAEEEIDPGEDKLLSTGVCLELPDELFGKIEARSSLARRGLQTLAGVIDGDYRGEIKVLMRNFSKDKIQIQKGDRIAQICLLPNLAARMIESQSLNETERADKGFGSTGR